MQHHHDDASPIPRHSFTLPDLKNIPIENLERLQQGRSSESLENLFFNPYEKKTNIPNGCTDGASFPSCMEKIQTILDTELTPIPIVLPMLKEVFQRFLDDENVNDTPQFVKSCLWLTRIVSDPTPYFTSMEERGIGRRHGSWIIAMSQWCEAMSRPTQARNVLQRAISKNPAHIIDWKMMQMAFESFSKRHGGELRIAKDGKSAVKCDTSHVFKDRMPSKKKLVVFRDGDENDADVNVAHELGSLKPPSITEMETTQEPKERQWRGQKIPQQQPSTSRIPAKFEVYRVCKLTCDASHHHQPQDIDECEESRQKPFDAAAAKPPLLHAKSSFSSHTTRRVEAPGSGEIVAYQKCMVYASDGEFSFEEVRARSYSILPMQLPTSPPGAQLPPPTPTMTLNTRAALDDIMGMFHKPLDRQHQEFIQASSDSSSEDENDDVERTCTIIQQLPVQKLMFQRVQVYRDPECAIKTKDTPTASSSQQRVPLATKAAKKGSNVQQRQEENQSREEQIVAGESYQLWVDQAAADNTHPAIIEDSVEANDLNGEFESTENAHPPIESFSRRHGPLLTESLADQELTIPDLDFDALEDQENILPPNFHHHAPSRLEQTLDRSHDHFESRVLKPLPIPDIPLEAACDGLVSRNDAGTSNSSTLQEIDQISFMSEFKNLPSTSNATPYPHSYKPHLDIMTPITEVTELTRSSASHTGQLSFTTGLHAGVSRRQSYFAVVDEENEEFDGSVASGELNFPEGGEMLEVAVSVNHPADSDFLIKWTGEGELVLRLLKALDPPLFQHPNFHSSLHESSTRGTLLRDHSSHDLQFSLSSFNRLFHVFKRVDSCTFEALDLGDESEDAATFTIIVSSPPSPWDFYIRSLLAGLQRPSGLRTAPDVSTLDFVCFRNESFLILPHATPPSLSQLLMGEPLVLDELTCAFFIVEILKALNELHTAHIIHGQITADAILMNLKASDTLEHWDCQYQQDGGGGWKEHNIQFTRFNRSVDLRLFPHAAQFLCDASTVSRAPPSLSSLASGQWAKVTQKMSKPWHQNIDFFGVYLVCHQMLFGCLPELGSSVDEKCNQPQPLSNRHSPHRFLKMQVQWQMLLDNLLVGDASKVAESMLTLQLFLVENCESDGRSLRSSLRRMEIRHYCDSSSTS